MDENYRLVFRGEVLDDQHPAVVRKRLVEALKLSDAQGEKLFSGRTVVIKHNADTKTAARYQGLFKRAGARLRVLPVAEGQQTLPASGEAQPDAPASPAEAESSVEHAHALADADAGELKLQGAQYAVEHAPRVEIGAPDFSLAELGANMADAQPEQTTTVDVDFELAEVGEPIPNLPKAAVSNINVDDVNFELAEVGADIGEQRREHSAVAPDVSHLALVD